MSVSPRPTSRAISGLLGVPPVLVAALDPGSTRLVYAMVAGLVVIGIVFVVLGVWLVRQTRYDPPVLAPLERMGDADWRKRDEATQRRILDEVRPQGAVPLRPESAPPDFDTEFDIARREPGSVADLGPGVSTPTPPPPPPRPQPASAEDTTAEDTTAEDTTAEDTTAEDTTAEDTTAEDTGVEEASLDDADEQDGDDPEVGQDVEPPGDEVEQSDGDEGEEAESLSEDVIEEDAERE